MATNILSKFKLTDKTRSGMLVAPETHRRMKMLDAIEQQIAAVEADQRGEIHTITKQKFVTDANSGEREKREVQVPVKPWWWKDMAGLVYLSVKYGNRRLEIQPGKSAIEVGAVDKLQATLEMLAEAVKTGELDDVIGALSRRSKPRLVGR